MTKIAGIDFSLCGPAMTVYDSSLGDFTWENCKVYFLTSKKKCCGSFLKDKLSSERSDFDYQTKEERWQNLGNYFLNIIDKEQIKAICLEDYALGAKGMTFDIAEATGYLKMGIYNRGIKLVLSPPKSAKKSFTGNGNAGKFMVVETFKKKTDFDLNTIFALKNEDDSPIGDICDSFSMCEYLVKNLLQK